MPETKLICKKPKHILVLAAYDGGSHGQFLDGLISYSKHIYTRISMKPRRWKWRMHGSALWFVDEIKRQTASGHIDPHSIDIIFTTDMTSVCDLKALLPKSLSHCQIVLYFHENQFAYPVQCESERDYQFGFTNITSALAADHVWFNSRYNLESFADQAESFIQRMPDCLPENIGERIKKPSIVMPLGLDVPETYINLKNHQKDRTTPPTIVWNHRWEHDKNPELFFNTLFKIHQAGIDFHLIILGESFKNKPPIFDVAQEKLHNNIIHCGYAPSRMTYYKFLTESDVIVSTALHEFFGLSVLEAIACGATPLLPYRLSYPELIPEKYHEKCFYHTDDQLIKMLTEILTNGCRPLPANLHDVPLKLQWTHVIKKYDNAFLTM
jgi:glycosyltransferase involved in cell wall biosynthesis